MARILCNSTRNSADTPQVHDEDQYLMANERINTLLDEEAYYESKGYWPELEEAQAARHELEMACEAYEGDRFRASIYNATKGIAFRVDFEASYSVGF